MEREGNGGAGEGEAHARLFWRARRNLSPDDFRLAVGRRYNRMKRAAHRPANNVDKMPTLPERTSEVIASESGIDERTVRRAGKLAEAVEEVARQDLARPPT